MCRPNVSSALSVIPSQFITERLTYLSFAKLIRSLDV